jgi:hypothetical protein
MRRVSWRRLGTAGVAAMVVALSVTAGTASAATPRATALARWHNWTLAHGAGIPQFNFAAAVALSAGPREVLISGVRYEMDLLAFEFLGSSPVVPSVTVDLERPGPPGFGSSALQFHDYSFNPQSGATFTFVKKTLATADLDMGTSIVPSTLTGTFTASGPASSKPCRLVTGGHGFVRSATGTMAYPAFGIDTSTSPFFGTLSTGPVQASVGFDPGCSGVVSFASAANPEANACPGREGVVAQTQTQQWAFEKIYAHRAVAQSVFTGTNPNSTSVTSDDHGIFATTSIYTLPRPVHSSHGATAKVFASGDPFMTGSATFTSTRAPAVARHTCIAKGITRHFTTERYGGQLAPTASPMTAEFDTAPVALTPLPATLTIRLYH